MLAIDALDNDAVPGEIRDLHFRSLKSPVHPVAVYSTLTRLLLKRYVVRYRTKHYYEALGCERRTWRYVMNQSGRAFINDYFEEVDVMRRLASKMQRVAANR